MEALGMIETRGLVALIEAAGRRLDDVVRKPMLGQTLKILTSADHRHKMVEAANAAHKPHSARSAASLILAGLP